MSAELSLIIVSTHVTGRLDHFLDVEVEVAVSVPHGMTISEALDLLPIGSVLKVAQQ